MMKEEMTKVVSITARITEIDAGLILSGSRQADVVDARCIAMRVLHDLGYSTSKIARFFHRTETSVRNTLYSFESRETSNKLFKRIYNEIGNEVIINS